MNDNPLVATLYAKVLTAGGSANPIAEGEQLLAPDWQSVGNYSGQNKNRGAFLEQVKGFGQLMPDLSWKIEEMITAGDRVVVRSRACGTPKGPFFGVPPGGKRFEIMTIDIHTVKDGRITHTFHVEDWAGALAQLKG